MFKFKYAKGTPYPKCHIMSFYVEHTCYFPYMVYYKQTHVAKGRNLSHPKMCLMPSLLLESQSFTIVKKFPLDHPWSTRLKAFGPRNMCSYVSIIWKERKNLFLKEKWYMYIKNGWKCDVRIGDCRVVKYFLKEMKSKNRIFLFWCIR